VGRTVDLTGQGAFAGPFLKSSRDLLVTFDELMEIHKSQRCSAIPDFAVKLRKHGFNNDCFKAFTRQSINATPTGAVSPPLLRRHISRLCSQIELGGTKIFGGKKNLTQARRPSAWIWEATKPARKSGAEKGSITLDHWTRGFVYSENQTKNLSRVLRMPCCQKAVEMKLASMLDHSASRWSPCSFAVVAFILFLLKVSLCLAADDQASKTIRRGSLESGVSIKDQRRVALVIGNNEYKNAPSIPETPIDPRICK
jgi:hypothetical protein